MKHKLTPVGFLGLGTYAPEGILTNQDLERMVETSDEWIVSRTGIRERHICAPGEATSHLATEAGRRALADAKLEPDQIDLIICCTFTPDHCCPATACLVQANLGIKDCAAFDLSAACSGFIYGCSVAAGFIRSGVYERVMVIGAEAITKFIDFEDRNTCVLFGDGAGAAILGRVPEGRGLLGQRLGADGTGGGLIEVPAGGSLEPVTPEVLQARRQYLRMNGNEVYKFATRICGAAIEDALKDADSGLKPADLDVIIPHQANVRIIEAAAKKLKIPVERFVVNIEKYGNTSAATVPLAMADARAEGRLEKDTLFALVAFGGGLTYAASIWRW